MRGPLAKKQSLQSEKTAFLILQKIKLTYFPTYRHDIIFILYDSRDCSFQCAGDVTGGNTGSRHLLFCYLFWCEGDMDESRADLLTHL